MLNRTRAFTSIVRAKLAMTPIVERLQYTEAVVLERIARGGGSVNWYYCRNLKEMSDIEELLLPGSTVSFYFDRRIRHSSWSSELKKELEDAIGKNSEIIVGTLENNEKCIDVTIVVSRNDLDDLLSTFSSVIEVFYGPFPSADNDGYQAVTVILPDNDGIVRYHPH